MTRRADLSLRPSSRQSARLEVNVLCYTPMAAFAVISWRGTEDNLVENEENAQQMRALLAVVQAESHKKDERTVGFRMHQALVAIRGFGTMLHEKTPASRPLG